MHILLTDQLTCPRCGPEFGLILLADEMSERRVRGGRLGCANCRSAYPITNGVADLRAPGASSPSLEALEEDDERTSRTAALLGVTGPNAAVLVVEETGAIASELAAMLPEVHVLSAVTGEPVSPKQDAGVISRFRMAGTLPLRRGAARGAALLGLHAAPLLEEAVRAVAPGGRIVVEPAVESLAGESESRGLQILLREAGVMVASTPGPR